MACEVCLVQGNLLSPELLILIKVVDVIIFLIPILLIFHFNPCGTLLSVRWQLARVARHQMIIMV